MYNNLVSPSQLSSTETLTHFKCGDCEVEFNAAYMEDVIFRQHDWIT